LGSLVANVGGNLFSFFWGIDKWQGNAVKVSAFELGQ